MNWWMQLSVKESVLQTEPPWVLDSHGIDNNNYNYAQELMLSVDCYDLNPLPENTLDGYRNIRKFTTVDYNESCSSS